MENSTQKISKISVSSSEYASECESEEDQNSMEYERTPQHSSPPMANMYNELVKTLSLTLSQREIPHNSQDSSFSNLKTLISTLCTEFLKSTQSPPSPASEPSGLILEKLFIPDNSSVTLQTSECKLLLGLTVNLLRESTQTRINSRIHELQISLINSAKTIKKLREELEEKNLKIECLQRGKNPIKHKKNKYLESESTLNESQDLFI